MQRPLAKAYGEGLRFETKARKQAAGAHGDLEESAETVSASPELVTA